MTTEYFGEDHAHARHAVIALSSNSESPGVNGARPQTVDVARQPAPDSARIRVHVVHTQPLVAESLAHEIATLDDMDIVGVDVTDEGVEARISAGKADIALLDAELGTVRIGQIIMATQGATRSLVIASANNPALIHACLLASAVGVLTSPRGLQDVAAAIRRAYDGRIVLTQDQLAALMSHTVARPSDTAARALCERLSDREREILTVLATGASTDAVAAAMHISRHTVQSHIKHALRKLRVRSKLAAVVLMMAAGPIDME